MSNKDTGGPAFPSKGTERARKQAEAAGVEYNEPSGMTLRDYFAAKALQGMITANWNSGDLKLLALDSYQMADAMLQARKS